MSKSQELFKRAVKCIPGGVNSPVRAFNAVGGNPRFIKRAEGAYIYDVDGNKYIDYIGSWGPMILGHDNKEIREAVIKACENGLSFGAATEIEVEMAELICELIPSIEMIRMVNSGTEAVMSAIRAARGYTGRNKIIKFAGCYHGHSDSMLVKAGSGVMVAGVPDSAGVPKGCAEDTLTAIYNDISSVEDLFNKNKDCIAAVIIEPVAANMGVVLPEEGFLNELRRLCTENGSLLIFDEVITGFRLSISGAQGYYDIKPDLTIFGKIIGGGMPVGAYGGRRDIMEQISPVGTVYQAGTLSGNPIAMAAGKKELEILRDNPQIYTHLNKLGSYYRKELKEILKRRGLNYSITGVGSLSCLFFTDTEVKDYESAKTSEVRVFGRYFNYMLERGIYIAPAQFEAMFISNAHTYKEIDITLEAAENFLKTI
ncbi:glutamate-1-semialdehyde 2,1-aminomutase [Clostridium polynesiense]|uniref:glutamate-1-semialdehyde 2,1-aminomutase n=1 Tax=Clostridium polynesiense TaxID=1325933 RepID=UPI00058C8753|nr:glutamate-1-semialdehyde 2,1-aminomutase [Clostridium polynesiense]